MRSGPPHAIDPPQDGAPEAADCLVREAFSATLATIDRATGHPYASLVEVAAAADGAPLILISGLARHTRNLQTDARASLLFDRRDAGDAALATERATIIGSGSRLDCERSLERFLRRHPDARRYVGLGDFTLWRFEIHAAHFVGGFGRIRELAAEELPGRANISTGHLPEFAAAEPALSETLSAWLQARGAGCAGWTVTGTDAGGIDLVCRRAGARRAKRLVFQRQPTSSQELEDAARHVLGTWNGEEH